MQILEGKLFGLRRSALIEMALFFAIMWSIDFFFGSGLRFFHVSPQPYWIIVLLITVQYGTNEGVAAALLSSIFLFLGSLPEQSILQDRFEYIIFLIKNPILWFVVAVIIGETRVRQMRTEQTLREELGLAHTREATIAKSYEGLKKIKENMEVQIVSEMHTAIDAYEAFKQLEERGKEELLIGSYDLVQTLLEPTKFSIFALKEEMLECLCYKGWVQNDSFKQKYSSNSRFYQKIITTKQVISVLDATEREILKDEGVIVAPIIDTKLGNLFGIIKIEEIGFLQLKVTTLETLRLVGEWIGTAYANKIAYEKK